MLVYQKLERNDETAVTEMYETYLNAGASIRGYIRDGLGAEGFVGFKCVDTDSGRLAGMISARPGVAFTCGHPELVELVRRRWGGEGLYTGDMLAVDPAYRRRGVGRELAVRLREGLLQKHAACMVMELWLRCRDGDVPALHPLQNAWKDFNIITLTIVRDFYKNLADYGLTCPECGASCKCGALIAALELHDPPGGEDCHEEA